MAPLTKNSPFYIIKMIHPTNTSFVDDNKTNCGCLSPKKCVEYTNSLFVVCLQNADSGGDNVRRLQSAAASSHSVAPLGPDVRQQLGYEYNIHSFDIPNILHEFVPESASVRVLVAQFS